MTAKLAAYNVTVGTAGGHWTLAWHAEHATFTATHRRHNGRVDVELGAAPGALPTLGALEETLGWPLPDAARDALTDARRQQPALAIPRGAAIPELDRPRPADTRPGWSSPVTVGDIDDAPYGLLCEQDRPLASVEVGDTRVDVLDATPDPASGATRVTYRLTHQSRVLFSGDDVNAPPGATLTTDADLAALLAVLSDPDPAHRARSLTHPQSAFLAEHHERLIAAPAATHPWPSGTRIAHDDHGVRRTGTVAHAVTGRDGDPLAYAWRPDIAGLCGHPWRYEPDLLLISAPQNLTLTLTASDRNLGEPGAPLAFGAVVAYPDPATCERAEGTVIRAFADGDTVTYQIQSNTAEARPALTVNSRDCAPLRGTWWASAAELVAARRAAGLEIVDGELLAGRDRTISRAGNHPAPHGPTGETTAAALTVDVDGEPAPSLVKVSTHGQLTRVGDPDHGWLVVGTDAWLAAMCRPADELRAAITDRAPNVLTGTEPRPTLAALTARHAPDTLGAPPARLARRLAAVESSPAGAGL